MSWGKAREGDALSVQELGFSTAMANFVALSRTWSGPSIPQLKTLWPGSTRLCREQTSASSICWACCTSPKHSCPFWQEMGEYMTTTLAASSHNNMVVCYRAQIFLHGIEKSVCTGKCITSSPQSGTALGSGWCCSPHAIVVAVWQQLVSQGPQAPWAPLYIHFCCRELAFFSSFNEYLSKLCEVGAPLAKQKGYSGISRSHSRL